MNDFERLLYKTLYKKSFYEFYKAFWKSCDPHDFIDGDLVQFLCETFQFMCKKWIGYEKPDVDLSDISEDMEVIDFRNSNQDRMSISMPPRHSKSMIFNVMGATWLWTYHPISAVSISHTFGLAKKMNEGRYAIINSQRYKEIYGNEIKIIENSKDSIKDTRGGQLYSQSRDALTGYGGDIIINDDLTNAQVAYKDQQEMRNAWNYYQNTMPSRINDIKKSCIFNIQQRLGVNDIVGHILKEPSLRDQYIFINLQAIFEKDTCLICPISGKKIIYKKGDSLWKERFGDYSKLKAEVGTRIFETQYQQKPKSSDMAIIEDNMIIVKPETECPSIENAEMIYASHDFPVKDKETSDYLGSVLGYRIGNTLYISECIEKHMAFPQSVKYVKKLSEAYPGIIQIIEDKANGSPILQQLQGDVIGLQAYNPGTSSKSQRLESASLYMESKNVVFVQTECSRLITGDLHWFLSEDIQNLVDRLLSFPMVEHDDIVDAFDMLVNFVFLDKNFSVYGKSFNDDNIISYSKELDSLYENVFFNKEGDLWKACKIKIKYGIETKLIVSDEIQFQSTPTKALKILSEFAPNTKMFIDCSDSNTLYNIFTDDITIERYEIDDFDKSVLDLNLAFSTKQVLVLDKCKFTKGDIEIFKRAKTKTIDDQKYITTKDGFVACLRVAMKYYGGIV